MKACIQTLCLIVFSTLVCATPTSSHQTLTSTQIKKPLPQKAQIWNLKDADIRAVIQTVSMVTGKNFIIDPRVNGKITLVSQKPMTPDEIYQVFLSLLQVLNYTAVPSHNSIQIIPSIDAKGYNSPIANKKHPAKGDEVVVRIIHVKDLSAMNLIPILRPLMQNWGSISAYNATNSLILAGSAGNIDRLARIVKNMENQHTQHTQVIQLKFTNASKLASTLQALQQSEQAKGETSTIALAADKQNNSLLVSGNFSDILEMRTLIKALDTPGKSDDKNTSIFHLNYLDATKLAPLLVNMIQGKSSSAQAGAPSDNSEGASPHIPQISTSTLGTGDSGSASKDGVSIQAEPNDNVIIAHASTDTLSTIKKIINELDVKPDQVLVEAVIVKLNQGLTNSLGIEWGQQLLVDPSDTGGQVMPPVTGQTEFGYNGSSFGLIEDTSLAVILHAIKKNSSTDILSTPSIVVLNNQKATISNGENVGINSGNYPIGGQQGQGQGQGDGAIFQQIQRKDVGLTLKVTPRISPNNMLQLSINQTDDSVEQTPQADPLNPTIATSKISTKVLVHSGDILVIGGLIDNEQTKTRSKIPILGDIPLIGKLFSYNNNTVAKRNLMVFIRPIILRDNRTNYRQTNHRYQYIRTQQMKAIAGQETTSDLPLLPSMPRKHRMLLPPPAVTLIKD